MEDVLASAHDVVHADYHMFYLLDEGAESHPSPPPTNGLIGSLPGIAIIHTGIASGPVGVEVQTRTGPPQHINTADWDDVVEHSIYATGGRLHVAHMDGLGDPPALPSLTAAGSGPYRILIHARGRDNEPDGFVFEVTEEYLIVSWPQELQTDLIHKNYDR